MLSLCLLALFHPAVQGPAQAESGGLPLGVVRVIQVRLPVPIENARRSFQVGDRVHLFQENEDFFIALAEKPYETRQLVAVPLRRGGRKVAWITPEHLMYFGAEIATVEGRLYLRSGEELPVIREIDGAYEVLVERLGQQATVWISKADLGIRFIPNPMLAADRIQDEKQAARSLRPSTVAIAPEIAERPTRSAVRRVLRQEQEPISPGENKIEHLFPGMDEELISFMLPDVPGFDWDAAAEAFHTETVLADQLEALLEDVLYALKRHARMAAIILLAMVLGIALIVSGLKRAVLKHAHPPALKKLAVHDEAAESDGASAAAQEDQEKQGLGADFSGSVASMSLGAVTQFLNSDKETGVLTVSKPDHKRIGAMFFADGEIVDAHTSDKHGVPAVYDLLKAREGLFAFVRHPKLDVKHTITQGTIALLLDAHRELDELNGEPVSARQSPPVPKGAAKKEKPGALRVKRRAVH